jgi:cytoskeletal protein CcmA (bactofilin family)
MSHKPPAIRSDFKVKKNLYVTKDAYVGGNLTIDGEFTNNSGNLNTSTLSAISLSAGIIYSGNYGQVWGDPVADQWNYPRLPLRIIDETIFEDSVRIWGDLHVDGNAYLSGGVSGTIYVGDAATDNVVFSADIDSNIIPDDHQTYDLGAIDQQWDTIFVQDVSASNDVNVGNDVDVQGNVHIAGDLNVDSNTHLLGGTTYVGNLTSDTFSVTSQVSGHLIPQAHNTYNIGHPDLKWNNLYFNTIETDHITGNTASFTSLTALSSVIDVIDIKVRELSGYDIIDGDLTIHENVVIGTSTITNPPAALTVVGDISATGDIYLDDASLIFSDYDGVEENEEFTRIDAIHANDAYMLASDLSGQMGDVSLGVEALAAEASKIKPLPHILPRGSWLIDTPTAGEREYITMQQPNFEGDRKYSQLTYDHAYILPYYATVRGIEIRSEQSATLANVGIHTNEGETVGDAKKFFSSTPTASSANALTADEATTYTFNAATTANAGSTLGVSISSTGILGTVNASVILEYDTTITKPANIPAASSGIEHVILTQVAGVGPTCWFDAEQADSLEARGLTHSPVDGEHVARWWSRHVDGQKPADSTTTGMLQMSNNSQGKYIASDSNFNNKPTIDFSGSNINSANPSPWMGIGKTFVDKGNNVGTIFYVGRVLSNVGSLPVIFNWSTNGSSRFGHGHTGHFYMFGPPLTNIDVTAGDPTSGGGVGTPFMVTINLNGAASYVQINRETSIPFSAGSDMTGNFSSMTAIGGNGSNYSHSVAAEMIIYDTALGNADVADVQSYLETKLAGGSF